MVKVQWDILIHTCIDAVRGIANVWFWKKKDNSVIYKATYIGFRCFHKLQLEIQHIYV